MRFFPLLDFQMVILLTFLGLAVLILLYIAFGYAFPTLRHPGREEEQEEYPEGIQATNRPIPPILIFVYVAFVVWAIAYVIVIGLRGGPF